MGVLPTDEIVLFLHGEEPIFKAWVADQEGFRPCPATTDHRVCPPERCTPVIHGTLIRRHQRQTLGELLDRWRSLGRPGPKTRTSARKIRSPWRPPEG